MGVPSITIEVDLPPNGTSSNPAPKVKLPDVKTRKPIVSESNSWAHSKELHRAPPRDTARTQPTNRDRYEDNPSIKVSMGDRQELLLPSKTYIQPAVPLINTTTPGSKSRAVTDPVQFRSLLTSRKPSVSQLKKKGKVFEFASSKLDLTDGVDLPHPNIAPKALLLLGVQQGSTQVLKSAPSQTQIPVPICASANDAVVPSSSFLNQVQSETIPTQYSPSEPDGYGSSTEAKKSATQYSLLEQPRSGGRDSDVEDLQRPQHATSNGNLHPPKVPVYGNVGKQHRIVEPHELHPSSSFHGIIETASPPHVGENDTEHQRHTTPTKGVQREPSGEMLRPTVYASGGYGTLWENDPATVSQRYSVTSLIVPTDGDQDHTLAPFTPIPKTGHPNHEHVPRGLTVGAPDVFQNAFRHKFPRNASAVHEPKSPQGQEIPPDMATPTSIADDVLQPQHACGDQSRSGLSQVPAQLDDIHRSHSRSGPWKNAPHCQQPHPTQSAQHGLQQAIFDSRPQSVFDHPPLTTANSWAPSQGNYPSSSHAPVSTFLPPRWPPHLPHNPVPSPPASQQDYQRPTPLSAGLAQLDLTLHHHIESVFGSLSRQLADRHDRVLDRVLLRIDNFEDNMCKELKGLRADFNSLKKEVGKLRVSVSEVTRSHSAILKDCQCLSSKVDNLEKHVVLMKEKDHITFADQSNSESNVDRLQRVAKHGRAESAHGSLGSSPTFSDQQGDTVTRATRRSSSKTRSSGNGNGARVVPDLREHPAYRQQRDLVGTRERKTVTQGTYVADSLVDGDWYHQAYGKGV